MKRLFVFTMLTLLVLVPVVACGPAPTPPPPPPTEEPAPPPAAPTEVPTTPTPAPGEPVHGGTYRMIYTTGPQVLSYVPLMGPGDHAAVFPATERLVDTTTGRGGFGIEPVLAESWEEDVENLKITIHLRQGVYFHDGTEMDAENVAWNIQVVLDAGALPYSDFIKEIKAVDEYTVVIDLNEYSNQIVPTCLWWPAITSKAAWDAAGTTDEERIEWARSHVVGTGPFMLEEFKRDVSLTWVKNPNYWREDRPYLDGIEVQFIPDPVTARAMFEAGEVDAWNGAPAKDASELMDAGYTRQSSWPALAWCVWINTAHPDSKWNDIRLREAVEYALDKEAIAQAMGFGLYRPLKSLPPEGEWGYDPASGRPYDPEMAEQLLADAGYSTSNPLKATLLSMSDPVSVDVTTMIKSYLDAVGFEIELDPADPGRFFGTIYWTPPGPELDLHWWISGRDTNYLQSYLRWFGIEPFTDLSYLGHTPEQAAIDERATRLVDYGEQEEITGEAMRYLMDNALLIPVYDAPAMTIQQPYVHSTQYEQGFVRWQTEEIWMEPH